MDHFFRVINAMMKGWELVANFRNLEHYMGSLRSKMDELSAREHDVLAIVEREEVGQGRKRKREVDLWLKNVKKIKSEVNNVEGKVREERRWVSRYKLIKSIEDITIKVVQLHEKSGFSDGVAIEPLLGSGSPQPTATLLGESANRTLQRIWSVILDAEVKKVGVHGMAGVGKTTIMKHIHNQLIDLHIFGSIIWVTVSKALDLQRLQREIAKAIGLDLSNDYDDEVESISSKICSILSRRGRCLLILDDVWEAFSLERIGIPEPNQTNGFKLVITTRSSKVCRGMESERIIKVEVLSSDEAWDLFKEKVGGSVLGSLEIEPIAKDIIKECGRLPLALVTVGRALREIDGVHVWRNALDELKRSCADIDGMEDYVFPRLMFSYNRLKNDTLRACFLYCALYPEDYPLYIPELIESWIGEGLIDEIGDMKKEKDKGYKILSELRDACLLEDGHQDVHVKLHDLIRDLAIIITRGKPRFIVKAGEQLKESPRVEEWTQDTKRVSLMNNKIEVLSGQPVCPALSTLLLQGNECLREISHSFFECIRALKFLDLSETLIESLPEPFSELKELWVLRLNSCHQLKQMPSVAKMKQLRVLELSGTAIEELPQGMEELANLRHLNLRCTNKLQMLPSGFISKLSLLEELMMSSSGWRWPSKSTERGIVVADIQEIESLTRLANLTLSFEDFQGFNNFVRLEKLKSLESFFVSLDKEDSVWGGTYLKKVVAVDGGTDVISHKSSLMLPYNTEALLIRKFDDISRMSQLPCLANATQIKYCVVSECSGMEFLVMVDEDTSTILETLFLDNLPNLRALSNGNDRIQAFTNLKELDVRACSAMKSLLTMGLLQCLCNLETIKVRTCNMMEDIVADDGNDSINAFSFPKLKNLSLMGLIELKNICNKEFTFPSLVSVEIVHCSRLKKLPFTSHNLPPTLKQLVGRQNWWDELEWEDPIVKTRLQGYFIYWGPH